MKEQDLGTVRRRRRRPPRPALSRDAAGGLGLHLAAHGPQRLDPPEHGWGAAVGGGGDEVIVKLRPYS